MKRFLLLTIIIFLTISTTVLAQGKDNLLQITAVSKEAKTKLKKGGTVAIFLTGNDTILTRIVEDTLSIHITNAGFITTNRETLEKSVGEQVAKKKKEKTEGTISALEIGAAINADAILIGTVFVEPGEQKQPSVKIASFQLVDVSSGKTVLNLLFESEKEKSFSEIGKLFVDTLKQYIE